MFCQKFGNKVLKSRMGGWWCVCVGSVHCIVRFCLKLHLNSFSLNSKGLTSIQEKNVFSLKVDKSVTFEVCSVLNKCVSSSQYLAAEWSRPLGSCQLNAALRQHQEVSHCTLNLYTDDSFIFILF